MTDLRKIVGSISVVIPAYNAESHVTTTLEAVRAYLHAAGLPHEIIVVDDGSRDGTVPCVQRLADVRLLAGERNFGKGHAVRKGMLAATLDWVLFMDADHSTRIENLARFAEACPAAAVVIASRRAAGARIVRRQNPLRQSLGRTFPYLVRALVLPEITDSQCGFKMFRRDVAQAVFSRQRIDRFAFDVEVLALARSLGHRIAEVPIDWDNPTDSTLRIGADGVRMFLDLLAIAWRFRGSRKLP